MKNKKLVLQFLTLVFATTVGLSAVVALALAAPVPAHAQAAGDLGTTVNGSLELARKAVGWSEQSLPVIIMRVVQVAMGFLGILAILVVLYGGFVWMTSGGDEGKVETAKAILRNGVIGLLLILMAFAIASFVLRMLVGAFGPQPRGVPGRVPACEGCDALGGGIIEAVYPAPGATDVARDTMIFVTFKELMDKDTLIKVSTVAGEPDRLNLDNVKIRFIDPVDGKQKDYTGAVNASTPDNQTFVFDPVEYLGDGVRNVVYTVDLLGGIRRQSGQPAFPGTPGHFAWSFTVGTRLDLAPPTVKDVWPIPDALPDGYDPTAAVAAVGELELVALPRPQQNAAVSTVTLLGPSLAATVAGTYSCDTSALVCVHADTQFDFRIWAKDSAATGCTDPVASDIAVTGLATGARRTPATNQTIALGCGLTMTFVGADDSNPTTGSQWRFTATAGGAADTLRLGSRRYTFVSGAPASTDQIQVDITLVGAANKIRAAITADPQSPVTLNLPLAGSTVGLRSKVLGTSGNLIDIVPSRAWANVTAMSGGENATERLERKDQQDVARNAVIHLDFSEAMLPTVVAGDVLPPTQVTERADVPGVGSLVDPGKPPYLTVQADLDGDAAFADDEYIAGKFLISNLYRTVEFKPATRCGVCDVSGVPCTSNAQCTAGGGDTCEEQRNSCGDLLYCLPTRGGVAGGVTRYQVSVNAANLKMCDPADPNNACFDADFSECPAGGFACRSTGSQAKNYPKAATAADGVVDAANNSLDGNADYRLDGGDLVGPTAAYVLNIPRVPPASVDDGDSLAWTFYVNRTLQLTPPNIVSGVRGIDPLIDQAPVSVVGVPSAGFSSLLMSATLRPGSNYRDGRCFCSAARSACPTGQSCDVASGVCKMNDSGAEPVFCQDDRECPNNAAPLANSCVNKRYVSLVDIARRRVGWWITGEGLQEPPLDGYADRTAAQIQHTPFAETTQYGAEYGSGIQDLYQNCFLPSEGPDATGAGRCGTTRTQPYCCSGRPSATACP